jgi:hypothetical protein
MLCLLFNVVIFLLLVFCKLLELNRHFTLQMISDTRSCIGLCILLLTSVLDCHAAGQVQPLTHRVLLYLQQVVSTDALVVASKSLD